VIKNDPAELKLHSEKLYGIYRGVVEENDDSTEWKNDSRWEKGGTGRVRVRVWGIHTKNKLKGEKEGIPVNELPWAEPAYPIIEGSISGVGIWSVPVQGTHVFLFFENGDHMQPRYFACAPGIQPSSFSHKSDEGLHDPDGIYPTTDYLNEPDYSKAARGIEDGSFIGIINDNLTYCSGQCRERITEDQVEIGDYPHITSLETHGGHALLFDSTPDEKRFFLYHPSKSYATIFPDGKLQMHFTGVMKTFVDSMKMDCVKGAYEIISGTFMVDSAAIYLFAQEVLAGNCGGHKAVAFWDHTHECPAINKPTDEASKYTVNFKAT
jgi:hypothetical protein